MDAPLEENISISVQSYDTGNGLIILSAEERLAFMRDNSLDEIKALLPACEIHLPPPTEPQWHALLTERQPQILIGCWAMPSLETMEFALLRKIKYIGYIGGSVRNKVPRSYIAGGGIVTNWGPAAAATVAECALALILGCLRRFTRYTLELHIDRAWNGPGIPPPFSLYGRRIGLHGFGSVARQLITLLRPFGVVIEAWSDPVPSEVMQAVGVARARDLKSLFVDNEIVVEIEGLTEKTRGCVTRDVLNGLRSGAVFVNVGRGAVVDYNALEDLAVRGDITIGLDVYNPEPLSEKSRFIGLRNVLLLPHIAGPTKDHYPLIWQRMLLNLRAYLQVQTPEDIVTLEHYDNAT